MSQLITELRLQLPFLISLSDEERNGGMRMGFTSLTFIKKALQYAESNPGFVSDYINLDEFRRDFELATDLFELLDQLKPLVQMVEDTAMQAATEALPQAMSFYTTIGMAQSKGVAHAAEIHDDLCSSFPGRKLIG